MRVFAYTLLFIGQLTPMAWAQSLADANVPATIDEVVLIVDDQAITAREFTVLRQLQDQDESLAQAQHSFVAPQLGEAITEAIIDERLLVSHARRLAPNTKISDGQISAAVQNLASRNQLSAEQLLRRLQSQGVDLSIFKESLAQRLLVQEVIAARISRNVNVQPSEIKDYINNRPELRSQTLKKYRASHLVVPIKEGANDVEVETLRGIALISRERLSEGESFAKLIREIAQVQSSNETGDLGLKREDELPSLFVDVLKKLEIGQISPVIQSSNGFHLLALTGLESASIVPKEYHVRHILRTVSPGQDSKEVAAFLQNLKLQILAGVDFATIASAQSQDAGSAEKGGDIGWISIEQVEPQFAETLKKLTAGQISDPIQTPFGLHLVQLLQVRDQAGGASLPSRVRQKLFAEKVSEGMEDLLNDLKQIALIEVISPDE